MKIFVVESVDKKINPYETSVVTVLKDLGIKKGNIIKDEGVNGLNSSFAILILATLSIGHQEGKALYGTRALKKIKEFVRQGGICWVMPQQINDINLAWLPSHLDELRFRYRYIPFVYRRSQGEITEERNYLCPWIMQRDHPIWNKPNHVDESRFLYWEPEVERRKFFTSATHVIIQKNWEVLAGYADPDIKLSDGAACVMEAGYQKGLYLWTEIFPPQAFWKREKDPGKEAWSLLLENILIYFKDFQRKKILRVRLKPRPWSVEAGKKVEFQVELNPEINEIEKVSFAIQKPDGGREEKEIISDDILKKNFFYIPDLGGTYQVRARVEAKNGAWSYAQTFIKVVKGFTPFRVATHVHATHKREYWTPYSLGAVYGIAKKLGIDVVILAYSSVYKGFYPRVSAEELKTVDSPEVRFFPGQEIHTLQRYGPEDGAPENLGYGRRHVCVLGEFGIEHHPWCWERATLRRIHRRSIATVAHPDLDPWWIYPQDKDNFEGVALSPNVIEFWDNALKKGRFVIGIHDTDNVGIAGMFHFGYNTCWFDQPISFKSVIDTILKGRVTMISRVPQNLRGKDDFLWFDINNQVIGGTVYAVDQIRIYVKAKMHLKLETIRLVKFGDRDYRKIKFNTRHIDHTWEEKVEQDIYYRVEIEPGKGYNLGEGNLLLTNPIFIKKVEGPPGTYFYLRNHAPCLFDKKEGRWIANLSQIKKVSFSKGVWEIHIFEPGKGKIFIGGRKMKRVEFNQKPVKLQIDEQTNETVIEFGSGYHRLKLYDSK